VVTRGQWWQAVAALRRALEETGELDTEDVWRLELVLTSNIQAKKKRVDAGWGSWLANAQQRRRFLSNLAALW
jgi:enamine deaminase RidA (YjgF/YER057c/UK114 family)